VRTNSPGCGIRRSLGLPNSHRPRLRPASRGRSSTARGPASPPSATLRANSTAGSTSSAAAAASRFRARRCGQPLPGWDLGRPARRRAVLVLRRERRRPLGHHAGRTDEHPKPAPLAALVPPLPQGDGLQRFVAQPLCHVPRVLLRNEASLDPPGPVPDADGVLVVLVARVGPQQQPRPRRSCRTARRPSGATCPQPSRQWPRLLPAPGRPKSARGRSRLAARSRGRAVARRCSRSWCPNRAPRSAAAQAARTGRPSPG
jgi:hypothetical protein